jgi:tRNA threonylcarbamoyladenosine biosynthesis protein TsaE
MLVELRTQTAEETRGAGEAIAGLLRGGDAVSLTGDLGAGKTTLVQGAAHGLGVAGPVVSPTFTLVREYEGRLRVVHVDVYRLDRMQDAIDLGLEELAGDDAVLFVEWGDAIEALLPGDALDIELTVPDPASEVRRVRLAGSGPPWAERWERLEQALEPWTAAA